jgi:xanthine dehydrogenase accessory factor
VQQLQSWQFILQKLQHKIPVMLLYVVESKGSSPGRQGFFMAVDGNGKMHGSIGGGIMEHKFVEMAKDKLSSDETQSHLRKQVHSKSSAQRNQSGMICSGEQTIVMYRLHEKDYNVVEQITESLLHHQNGTLILTPGSISFESKSTEEEQVFSFTNEGNWSYKTPIGFSNYLYIIGGGHCALALSQLIQMMDFHITVFEERKNLNTFDENIFAHQKKQVADYGNINSLIQEDAANAYVVIMTSGYRTDGIALKQLLGKPLKYLGVLGSKTKMKTLFDSMMKEGVSKEKLNLVFTPIGLQINSRTPQEIAVSIAAQIIQVKNKAEE